MAKWVKKKVKRERVEKENREKETEKKKEILEEKETEKNIFKLNRKTLFDSNSVDESELSELVSRLINEGNDKGQEELDSI